MGNIFSIGAGIPPRSTSPTRTPPAGGDTGKAPETAPTPHPSRTASAASSHTSTRHHPAVPKDDPIIALMEKADQRNHRSLFNGFKRMSPHVQDAIQQTNRRFPANLHGIRNPHNREERGVVFHDLGYDRLVPGPIRVGDQGSVKTPKKELSSGTARVAVHSHPFTGQHYHFEPSMADQIVARRYPHIEHIFQTPALRGENQYFTCSGAVPPRYYRLLPNPDNLPVPPNSPDRGMSAFHQRPVEGEQIGIPFSEL